jgi:hypothetical protein
MTKQRTGMKDSAPYQCLFGAVHTHYMMMEMSDTRKEIGFAGDISTCLLNLDYDAAEHALRTKSLRIFFSTTLKCLKINFDQF